MTTVHSADPPRHFQELARELDVALLRGPRDAMLALARVARRPSFEHAPGRSDAPDVSDLLTASGALPEHESALVLERYGVPFAQRRRAVTPDEAAAAAQEIGTPVVVKLDGPAHKARAGGVVLGDRIGRGSRGGRPPTRRTRARRASGRERHRGPLRDDPRS